MKSLPFFPGFLAGLLALLSQSSLPGTEISADQRDFFESKIRPVLIAECYECHSGSEAKGGLLLDSRPNLIRGGDSGELISLNDIEGSLLIASLKHSHSDADLHMPKNGAKLEDSIIEDFIAWIKMGAPDPRDKAEEVSASGGTWEEAYALRSKWWSLQPVKPYKIKQNTGHPVDYWIDKKLTETGLARNAPAEKFIRFRRLSYALTGLPPTPEELHLFLKDTSTDAWEKAVDRFLSSPAYGERWARHWMDLMRYAESHGSEGDPIIPYAWRYRDHLIRAFNDDVPYDQMVREHIAGDLLLRPRWNKDRKINESLLATANLRLMEHGFQPVDSLDEQVKTVDNQIEVLTKSFLGLTVSCARCHDHKFDAISQQDYYALYGIFASTRPGQVIIDSPELLNLHRKSLVDLKRQIKNNLADEWLDQAKELPEWLRSLRHSPTMTQHTLASLRSSLRTKVVHERSQSQGIKHDVPVALARWDFEEGPHDVMGDMDAELLEGAVIKDGRLILDGIQAFAQTPAISKNITAKTLETWIYMTDLTQRGGGAISIESDRGTVFDAIVYGEKAAGEWLAGSNNHRRTKPTGGAAESQMELVHLVAVYEDNGSVSFYRNGTAYGKPYPLESSQLLPEFEAGNARVLIGKRHTGGGRAYLKGEIEEAAIYDHALKSQQIADLYRQGLRKATNNELQQVMSEQQKTEYAALQRQQKQSQHHQAPESLKLLLDKAKKDSGQVLYPWSELMKNDESSFRENWLRMVEDWKADLEKRQKFNQENFIKVWDLTSDDYKQWTHEGNGLRSAAAKPGEFVISEHGETFISELLPAGVYSHLLSSKHAGLLISPFFKLESDSLSVRFSGDMGGGLRIIVDNYPLGNNDTYPQIRPDGGKMRWFKMDTSYRKGSRAYVEMATYGELTRPRLNDGAVAKKDSSSDLEGRSWFGISEVYRNKFSDKIPQDELMPVSALLASKVPGSHDELELRITTVLEECILAWKNDELSDMQQAFLNEFITSGVLNTELSQVRPETRDLVVRYRHLEREVPVPQRAPGPVEGEGYDSALMVRGNHHQLEGAVPRRFLEVLGGGQHYNRGSGRLELAYAVTQARENTLFSRVLVNRVWHWLFGQGLVRTVDNFGRLGEKPTHPELLDWLAVKFEDDGYSIKKLIRLLVTSETWQQGHRVSDKSLQVDAENHLWSYMPVRRLEAEAIRDAMLQVSQVLNHAMYGEPRDDKAYARSIYLPERRNRPHPFLEVFDRPKPSTTRGQRDVTNIPAQSLSMMNDNFVRHLANCWAQSVLKQKPGTDGQSHRVINAYEAAFSRQPSDQELSLALEYLEGREDETAWSDYLQALFASKEFIYLR